jgi:microcystin degradation protein MlrC
MTYFRLTTTDGNGMKNLSNVISIASCNNINGTILIANGGTKEVGVILNSSDNQTLELQVHNALGQLVEVKNLEIVKGYNNIRVDLTNVSNAVYYVSVYNGNEKLISKKILVSDVMR